MSRLAYWYILEQLQRMGWPKTKGIFKEKYINSAVIDAVVIEALHIHAGLGAGRPLLGITILADTFSNNPWTQQSTNKLLSQFKKQVDNAIKSNPKLPPWEALYTKHKMGDFDVPFEGIKEPVLMSIWASLSASSIYWGLTHENDMPLLFHKAKIAWEKSSTDKISQGLAISAKYPWKSLANFYQNCEDLFHVFESANSPLQEIPDALRKSPEISRRLTDSATDKIQKQLEEPEIIPIKKRAKIKSFECEECGHSVDKNAKYCPGCGPKSTEDEEGAPIKKETKIKSFECEECGYSVDENDIYCSGCGLKFTEDEEQAKLYCNNCGKEILKTTAKFCPQCGSNLI